MSYLIGLYIYYHGNNLGAFGFTRTDEYDGRSMNEGLNRPKMEELLPDDVAEAMRKQEVESKSMNYEDVFREAMIQSQESSYNLSKSKIGSNNYYDRTADGLVTDYSDDDGDLDMSIFDTLNGF